MMRNPWPLHRPDGTDVRPFHRPHVRTMTEQTPSLSTWGTPTREEELALDALIAVAMHLDGKHFLDLRIADKGAVGISLYRYTGIGEYTSVGYVQLPCVAKPSGVAKLAARSLMRVPVRVQEWHVQHRFTPVKGRFQIQRMDGQTWRPLEERYDNEADARTRARSIIKLCTGVRTRVIDLQELNIIAEY